MHRIKKRRISYLNTFFSFAVCLTVTKDPTPVTNEAPRNLRFAQILYGYNWSSELTLLYCFFLQSLGFLKILKCENSIEIFSSFNNRQ